MGYFNIFYKITRIIDFFTRKRNRKLIVALCLIGAFVFFSPSMTYAQYTNLDSQNLQNIRTKINEIDSTLDTYIPDIYTSVYSMDLDLENIRIMTNAISTNLNTVRTDVTRMAGYLITVRDTLTDVDSEIEDLLDKIDALNLKIDHISDTIDNIESILNSIGQDINTYGQLNHTDLEEIKELIKEYLYGDKDTFNVVGQNYPGVFFDYNNPVVRSSQTGYIWEFNLVKGYTYTFNFSALSSFSTSVSYCFKDNKINPVVGTNMSTNSPIDRLGIPGNSDGELTVLADRDCYIYFSTYNNLVLNSAITDYNPGQSDGIYGGLTNIQETTIIQDTQTRQTISDESQATRNTITSTDYNQSVVSVDTSSVDSISSTQTQGLFTTIFNSFNSAATGGVDSITIPLPHSNQIILYSNVVSNHLGSLSALVSAFWYFVFGLYAFKFVNNLIRSIKTGDILNGFNSSNEVISKDIL